MNNQAAQTMPLPPYFPEWSRMDNLGGVVPSEVRQALIAMYQQGYAAALSQTAGVAEGRVPVPAEPTPEMLAAWRGAQPKGYGTGINVKAGYRAMLAAAPAASGGEDECGANFTGHKFGPHGPKGATQCEWCGEEPQPPAAASVSERARALLVAECPECGGSNGYMVPAGEHGGAWQKCGTCQDGERLNSVSRYQALRAIEQALTQQRGEPSARIEDLGQNAPLGHEERGDAEQAYTLTAFDYESAQIGSRDWELYWRGWWHRSQLYTTPQPSADAVRELVKRWRDRADAHEQNALHACSIGLKESADSMDEKARALRGFADELESLLSAASGEKGVVGA